MKLPEWHNRFQQQARWSQPLLSYLLQKYPVPENARILEFGSGTGAVASFFTHALFFALDLDLDRLRFSRQVEKLDRAVCADAHLNPFLPGQFDVILCHYFLLWVKKPVTVLQEAKNLLKPNGQFWALAEPDYDSRSDSFLAALQNRSLQLQGASLNIGRQLGKLLKLADFDLIELGKLKSDPTLSRLNEDEITVLKNDLSCLKQKNQLSLNQKYLSKEIENYQGNWQVPTWFAVAKIK